MEYLLFHWSNGAFVAIADNGDHAYDFFSLVRQYGLPCKITVEPFKSTPIVGRVMTDDQVTRMCAGAADVIRDQCEREHGKRL